MARIWLDDIRKAPAGYIWCTSVNKAKFMILDCERRQEKIEIIDCDHDMGDFAKFNEVYAKYFVNKPARSCVAVKTLPENVLCEVEVIAEV